MNFENEITIKSWLDYDINKTISYLKSFFPWEISRDILALELKNGELFLFFKGNRIIGSYAIKAVNLSYKNTLLDAARIEYYTVANSRLLKILNEHIFQTASHKKIHLLFGFTNNKLAKIYKKHYNFHIHEKVISALTLKVMHEPNQSFSKSFTSLFKVSWLNLVVVFMITKYFFRIRKASFSNGFIKSNNEKSSEINLACKRNKDIKYIPCLTPQGRQEKTAYKSYTVIENPTKNIIGYLHYHVKGKILYLDEIISKNNQWLDVILLKLLLLMKSGKILKLSFVFNKDHDQSILVQKKLGTYAIPVKKNTHSENDTFLSYRYHKDGRNLEIPKKYWKINALWIRRFLNYPLFNKR